MQDDANANNEATLQAIRCHDVTVSLGSRQVAEFEQLLIIGMAIRLALHLRGVQVVPFELLKQVGLHLLNINPLILKRVVEVLAEVDFLKIDQQGSTIRSVVPTVPYYEDMFDGIGAYAKDQTLTEAEQLTLALLTRLAKSPTPTETIYNLGADKRLVDHMIDIGSQGGYVINKRARGRNMLVSPVYFSENAESFADLAAGSGAGRVGKVVNLLSKNQGWPLSIIKSGAMIGDQPLSKDEINIVVALAGEGFSSPPVIKTTHAGSNFFLFSPKPGIPKLTPAKRQIYERAMALVAAVRQGQLLPAKYKIKFPAMLLEALRDRKFLRASSESYEQYRSVAELKVGRLVAAGGGLFRFELIETRENFEAIDMAIKLIQGNEQPPRVEEDAILAFRKGQTYLDSLIGRQKLVEQEKVTLDQDTQHQLDMFILGIDK